MDSHVLKIPTKIAEHDWPVGTRPVVSICCITYNHEKFIAQAIEGFLKQETTFPVEIYIHDDASTDATAGIIQSYQLCYPRLIKAVFQKENQYSKGNSPFTRIFSLAKGDFISYCEGDDYWTDPYKLERQVSYLLDHPQVVLCFHDVISVDPGSTELASSKINALMGSGQPMRLINYAMISRALIPTLSIVFRNVPMMVGPKGQRVVNGDSYLFAMLSRYGEMHNMGVTMGAHRRHPGGIWTSLDSSGRTQALLKTLSAIAWEIDLGNCQVASRNLGERSWLGFWNAVCLNSGAGSITYVRMYISSMFCCIRCLRLGWGKVPSIIMTEIRIIWIPFRFIVGSLIRNIKRILGQQSFR